MKTKILAITLLFITLITACEKEGGLITVSGLESSELMTSESNIVLSKEAASSLVLAFSWNKSELAISDTSMSLPSTIPAVLIEVSATADFATVNTITPTVNTYTFTGAALNTLAKNLGFTPYESTPMYIRINSALGSNTEPCYSNIITIYVTSYFIDMSKGFILNADKEETGFTLYSPDSDGEYAGFTGAGAWYNWLFLEGDDTTWGTLGEDDKEFIISNDQSSQWKLWYPGKSGCYYTTLSTNDEEWTATYIPSLTVSGDIDAEMTFVKDELKWLVSFTTTTNNASVKVSCSSAALYNKSTSTDDGSAIAKTIGFIPGNNNSLSFEWNSESAGDFTLGAAGDYTLLFYLSDPKALTYEIKSGLIDIEEPASEYLYLPGIDHVTSGSWTFDNYLRLVSEDNLTYAGVVSVNSTDGYNMAINIDDWSNVYKMGATEGSLAFQGTSNIPAPAAGLYLIQADLKNLTYSHTAVSSLSYAGFNDSWTKVEMSASDVTGVYTSAITINTVSTDGFKLYLNDNWDYAFGGSNGVINYQGQNITEDAAIGIGSYDLIADIRNNSYTLLSNVIYLSGINDDWTLGENMTLTKTATGIYKGSVTITKTSSHGITIQLDKTWTRYFGGSFDSLSYLGANITDDQSLATGTYNVTVDFINNTCSFVLVP